MSTDIIQSLELPRLLMAADGGGSFWATFGGGAAQEANLLLRLRISFIEVRVVGSLLLKV